VLTAAFCVGVLSGYLLLVHQFMERETKDNLERIRQNTQHFREKLSE